MEITLEKYLAENPGKTKKNVSIDRLGDVRDFDDIPLDVQYIERQDTRLAAQVIRELLEGDTLTETQRRRFVLHIIQGLSIQEIADMEGTSHVAIIKSIRQIIKKVKKYFHA